MDKEKIYGLKFYFESAAQVDEGIRKQTIEVLNDVIKRMEADEAALNKKRKINRSGIVRINANTGKIIAEYPSQKDALDAIGREGTGISDAVNGRVNTHIAYGDRYYFKNELDQARAAGHLR